MSTKVEVDTKGLCFVCWNTSYSCPPKSNSNHNHSTFVNGFEKLLRYLEVNLTQLFHKSREAVQSGGIDEGIPQVNANDIVEVVVRLCGRCSLVTKEVNELLEEREVPKQQLVDCVQSLHQSIKNLDDCLTCTDHYKKQMKSKQVNQVFNAMFAASLRQEIFEKCSSKLAPVSNVASPRCGENGMERTSKTSPRQELSQPKEMEGIASVTQESLDVAVVEKSPPPPDEIILMDCTHCNAKLKPEQIRDHKLLHHPEFFVHEHLQSKCTSVLCKEVLKQLLSNHRETEEGIKCPFCPNHITTLTSLKCHIVACHTNSFANDVLSYDARLPTEQPETEEEISDAPLEDSSTLSTSTVALPMATNGKSCVFCRRRFPSQALLNNHMLHDPCRPDSEEQMHESKCWHEQEACECSFCGQTFYSASDNLKQGILDWHFLALIKGNIPWIKAEPNPVVGDIMGKIRFRVEVGSNHCPLCTEKGPEFPSLLLHFKEKHVTELNDRVQAVVQNHVFEANNDDETIKGSERCDIGINFENTLNPYESENSIVVLDWNCLFCEHSFSSLALRNKHLDQGSCQPARVEKVDCRSWPEIHFVSRGCCFATLKPNTALKCHIMNSHIVSMVMNEVPERRVDLIRVIDQIMYKNRIIKRQNGYLYFSCALCNELREKPYFIMKEHLLENHYTELVQQIKTAFEAKRAKDLDEKLSVQQGIGLESKRVEDEGKEDSDLSSPVSSSHSNISCPASPVTPVSEDNIEEEITKNISTDLKNIDHNERECPDDPQQGQKLSQQIETDGIDPMVNDNDMLSYDTYQSEHQEAETGDTKMGFKEALDLLVKDSSVGMTYTITEVVNEHKSRHDEQAYECSFCGQTFFSTSGILDWHFVAMVIRNVPWLEGELHPGVGDIMGKLRIRMDVQTNQCTLCAKEGPEYPSMFSLMAHISKKHFPELNQLIANVLHKEWTEDESVDAERSNEQMNFENILEPSVNSLVVLDWKCVICEHSFASRILRDKHMRQDSCQLSNPDTERHACGVAADCRAELAKRIKGPIPDNNAFSFFVGYATFDPERALEVHTLESHFVSMVMREVPGSREQIIPVIDQIMHKSQIQVEVEEQDLFNCALCGVFNEKAQFLMKRHLQQDHFSDLVKQIRTVFETDFEDQEEEDKPERGRAQRNISAYIQNVDYNQRDRPSPREGRKLSRQEEMKGIAPIRTCSRDAAIGENLCSPRRKRIKYASKFNQCAPHVTDASSPEVQNSDSDGPPTLDAEIETGATPISIDLEDNLDSFQDPQEVEVIDLGSPPATASSSTARMGTPWLLCVFCRIPFPSEALLDIHMRQGPCQLDLKREDARECPVCRGNYTSNTFLTKHMKCRLQIPSKCSFCDKAYQNRYCLKRHILNSHFKDIVMREIPGKSKAELNHAADKIMAGCRVRTASGRCQCARCGKKKTHVYELNIHLRQKHFKELVKDIRSHIQS